MADDDAPLAGLVRQGWPAERYTVDVAEDGEQARTMGSEVDCDLVILDLNLPRVDGLAVLRDSRLRRPTPPVWVLALRSKVEDREQCRDTGADDCPPKPFSFSELWARIRALLRRRHLPSESVLVVEDLKPGRVEHHAERARRRIELTCREFYLLEYLRRNTGRRVSRAMIIEPVWNLTDDTTTNVVDVYINVSYHHAPDPSLEPAGLVALVQLADLLCRISALNHGYVEEREVNLLEEPGFALLARHSTTHKDSDWARLTLELDSYMEEVRSLVRAVYRT